MDEAESVTTHSTITAPLGWRAVKTHPYQGDNGEDCVRIYTAPLIGWQVRNCYTPDDGTPQVVFATPLLALDYDETGQWDAFGDDDEELTIGYLDPLQAFVEAEWMPRAEKRCERRRNQERCEQEKRQQERAQQGPKPAQTLSDLIRRKP